MHGRPPTDAEIARDLGLRQAEVERVRHAARAVASLDQPVGEGEGHSRTSSPARSRPTRPRRSTSAWSARRFAARSRPSPRSSGA
ncbi:MAG: hypothetical protein M5U27_00265 [Gaiella sp.]|nr:hypothetical protein [Gaiella sp.]